MMKLIDKNNRNALFIIFEGIAFTVVLNLFNPFVQMFAKRMGAGDIHIALINSLPPLVAIFVLIPCGIFIDRINRKKQTVSLLIFINGLFYLITAFVPFIPHQAKVMVFVILIGLMNCPGSLYITTWQSFFADNFSGLEANRVYSVRSKYGTFFGLFTVLLTGLILSEIPKSEGQRILIYQVFYFVCFLISLLQLFFLSRIKQRTAAAPDDNTCNSASFFVKEDFKELLNNRNFMIFCICTFLFHITWQMGWPLFFLYNADYAGLNEFQFGMISVASGLTSFLSFSIWNRLIEKKGSRFTIVFGALSVACIPFFFTRLMNMYGLIAINALIGISGSGFALILFCSLLEMLPENKKTIYTSFYNTFINISGFIAPLIGIWIYGRLGIYNAFLLIGILRMAASMLFVARWWTGRRKYKLTGNKNTDLEV